MGLQLYGPLNTGAAAGGAGVATANASSTVTLSGLVRAVYVKYNGSPPAGTTDVTIATVGTSPNAPALTILTLTNAATDGWFNVRHQVHDNTGTALTLDGTRTNVDLVPIHDLVKATIAQANNDDSADVWILYEA